LQSFGQLTTRQIRLIIKNANIENKNLNANAYEMMVKNTGKKN
jgi:hypothetical protein